MNIFYDIVKRILRAFRKFFEHKKKEGGTTQTTVNLTGGGRRGRRTSTAQRRTIGNPLLELQDVPGRRGGKGLMATPTDKDLWSWKFGEKGKNPHDDSIFSFFFLFYPTRFLIVQPKSGT